MQPDGHRPRHIPWLFVALVCGACATTEPPPAASPARDVAAKESRVADWNQLVKALSGLASTCGAVGKSRDGEATGIALPAECLSGREGTAVVGGARPAVAAIARELRRVTDREFWIAARSGGQTQSGGRANAARAAALVNALVAEGVAPDRLAAVVGFGDAEGTVYDGPAALTGAALVEIIVAPSHEEVPASLRTGVNPR
ncbi:MAG: hypothetical protein ABUL77_04070 [Bacteroidota bacterium]